MSANPPFLTDEEIYAIAYPLKQAAAIMRWFINNGFPNAKPRPSGLPLISRSYFDQATVGIIKQADSTLETSVQPNVQAYLDRIAKGAKSKGGRQKV